MTIPGVLVQVLVTAEAEVLFFIDKFVAMVGALDLTVGANALNTVWRQFGLLLGNGIRRGIPYH